MKPVAIFRHAPTEGPGYFATYLAERSIPWKLLAIDEGIRVPRDIRQFSGVALMGGPMSVNDALPWIAPVLEFVREAVRKDVPVIGHCLGGQLMSKALGGEVTRNKYKEIGWGEVAVEDNGVAREWFGSLAAFEAFHWHGDTFSIPPGGTRVLGNPHCANQAFAMGKHLGLQCHVEMDPELVAAWCAEEGAREIEAAKASPAVQPVTKIQRNLDARLAALQAVARQVYDRWAGSLAR